MLVIPAYVFHRDDVKHVVLIGEGIAVAAVVMSILFVVVDLGRPERIWHMLPLLGRLHFPASLLAWDVVVLSGYLVLNLAIPFYILFSRYRGREPDPRLYFPAVLVSIGWAISIHTVTAFLFSSNVARPFWHTAVLGPRFLASAFTSGPALIVLALHVVNRTTPLKVQSSVIDLMALIATVALQINLFLLGAEIFTDFYFRTEHVASATYLYLGLHGANKLVPWIWSALVLQIVAATILTVHPLRTRRVFLGVACVLAIVGVWIEKGMGLVVPGFVPTPLGEVFEYSPSWGEVFSPTLRRALWVGVGLAILQQVTGINAIIYYANEIFAEAGFTTAEEQAKATLYAVGAVNVLATLIAVAWVDRKALCVVSLVFVWRLVPETKGRSLEEIQERWVVGGDRMLEEETV